MKQIRISEGTMWTWQTYGFKRFSGDFLIGAIFEVFIEIIAILLLFYVLIFWLKSMWNLSSLTIDRTCTPGIGR